MSRRTQIRTTGPCLLMARLARALPLALVLACGGEADTAARDSAASIAPTPSPGAASTAGPLTVADLDTYERGLAHEIALVGAAQARGRDAATPDERGAAMQAQFETSTMPAAAEHLGVAPDRYASVREAVHDVLRTLDMAGAIDGPVSIDTARASSETRARLADPYATLPSDVATALRARLDRLAPLYARYAGLVAVAG